MAMCRSRVWIAAVALASVPWTVSCSFSRTITITSQPDGARVWLGQQRVGVTPVEAVVAATGPLEDQTFRPVYATLRHPGYRDEVVALQYQWSARNVLASIPFVLGVPGILYWAKLPVDLHVTMEEATASD